MNIEGCPVTVIRTSSGTKLLVDVGKEDPDKIDELIRNYYDIKDVISNDDPNNLKLCYIVKGKKISSN